MTFSTIMNRSECIIYHNHNKNDTEKGIVSNHTLVARFLRPLQ